MNGLQIYQNSMFGRVRTMEADGKVIFCGSDVAKALGYMNPNKAINDHCRAITKRSTPISGKIQEINFISEGDVYRLITHSKLPTAEQFERWVFDDVLPSIRKTGKYETPQHQLMRAKAMQDNAKTRQAVTWLKIADNVNLPEYKAICAAYASKVLAGVEVLPLPVAEERHLTAGEIGAMLGVSAQKIGSTANQHGLKTNEYGKWYHDKSRYSNKEVDTFRYNVKGLNTLKGLLANSDK